MKHLIRYTESIGKNTIGKKVLDHDYIRNCFIDLIDSNVVDYINSDKDADNEYYGEGPYPVYAEGEEINTSSYFVMAILLPEYPPNDLEKWIQYTKELNEVLQDIKVAIDKVKIKYPDCECFISNEQDEEEIVIYYKW